MSKKRWKKPPTFTGKKLDWLACVNFDRRLKQFPTAFKAAYVIANQVDEAKNTAFISDAAIADKAGGISVPTSTACCLSTSAAYGMQSPHQTKHARKGDGSAAAIGSAAISHRDQRQKQTVRLDLQVPFQTLRSVVQDLFQSLRSVVQDLWGSVVQDRQSP